jgi:hypothetical protein
VWPWARDAIVLGEESGIAEGTRHGVLPGDRPRAAVARCAAELADVAGLGVSGLSAVLHDAGPSAGAPAQAGGWSGVAEGGPPGSGEDGAAGGGRGARLTPREIPTFVGMTEGGGFGGGLEDEAPGGVAQHDPPGDVAWPEIDAPGGGRLARDAAALGVFEPAGPAGGEDPDDVLLAGGLFVGAESPKRRGARRLRRASRPRDQRVGLWDAEW